MRPSWDQYFMAMAKLASTRSTCNSRPTGAVLVLNNQVLSTGYNGAMSGAKHCNMFSDQYCARREPGVLKEDRDAQCLAVHAEANAVAQAASKGLKVYGSTCYTTLAPCESCLKLLAAAGTKHIKYEFAYRETSNMVHMSPIETYTELTLSDRVIYDLKASLTPYTSRRRLPK